MNNFSNRIYETGIKYLKQRARTHRQMAQQCKVEIKQLEQIIALGKEVDTLAEKVIMLTEENQQLKTKKK